MSANNESTGKIILVAVSLCLACSVVVSTAAIQLKERQTQNKILDVKKNILLAAGLLSSPKSSKEEIETAYGKIEEKIIDLSTGEYVDNMDIASYNERAAAKDPSRNVVLPAAQDIAGIKSTAKLKKVFFVKENEQITTIILPVHGKGLWSTMYGFLALAPDTTTVKGFGYYEHGETPGLGGEVDNPKWKASWVGKKVLARNYEPAIEVVKGSVDKSGPNADYQVDGLSGATITSVGVTNSLVFWLGENGYMKFLEKFRNQYATASVSL